MQTVNEMERSVILYDGSFEGMLNGVACAVKSNKPIQGIFDRKHYHSTIFDTIHYLETDRVQAGKLFQYLLSVDRQAGYMALTSFLSEEPEAPLHLYEMVKKLLLKGREVMNYHNDDSISYLLKKFRQVHFEAHRFTGLIRFRIMDDQLLYAPFEPDRNIIGYLASHFKERFRNRKWILQDIKRDIAIYWDTRCFQDISIDSDFTDYVKSNGEIPQAQFSDEEKRFQELWCSYHRKISNPSRENTDLQRQRMPERYWKYLVEMDKT